jgi:hypothetical protein
MPKLFIRSTLAAAVLGASSLVAAAPPVKSISLELVGTYSQPDPAASFDQSATEISAIALPNLDGKIQQRAYRRYGRHNLSERTPVLDTHFKQPTR